jgi:hypothetical protein
MRAYWPFVLLFAFNKPLARYILKKLSQIFSVRVLTCENQGYSQTRL